jgi:Protein of unknown function (DUF1553)/Protein of unknown function (DUF1549)/Planctomycete cytochrome C
MELTSRLFRLGFQEILLASVCATIASGKETQVLYSRDIRPLLSNSCFTCHGPDEVGRQAALRLDLPEKATEWVIVPGEPNDSELINRIASDDPDYRMPPTSSHRPALSEGQVELFRRWIAQGAPYDEHWSYAPLIRPAVPTVRRQEWPINPIDNFIVAKLEEQNVEPSLEADRWTLARRLSLDILGLPPSPEQVAEFAANPSTDAYEKLVDLFLASPHYGERMAQFWLDLVRFADTSGIHNDYQREHYLYRDYVINAFNANEPFDEFTIEQLAGDLLPEPTRAQIIATGYNRLNLSTEESGSQEREFRVKYAADRVRNASTVWLAATLECAECHDHKFDRYTQRDFYCFAAFFEDIDEPAVTAAAPTPIPTTEQKIQLDQIDQQISALQKTLDTMTPALQASQLNWEENLRAKVIPWLLFETESAESEKKATLNLREDGSLLATGTNADKDRYVVEGARGTGSVTALRIDLLCDPSLPGGGPGRAPNGNFVLTNLKTTVLGGDEQRPAPIAITKAFSSYQQDGHLADAAVDEDSSSGWAGYDRGAPDHFAIFVFAEPISIGPHQKLRVAMDFGSPHVQHNLGRFRLAVTTAPQQDLMEVGNLPNSIAQILHTPAGKRSADQKEALAKYYRETCEELKPTRLEIATLKATREGIVQNSPKLLITKSCEPRITRILNRGNWMDESGEIVLPAVPRFLGDLKVGERRANRLDLAKWLVENDNPLTPRVFVNHLWKLAFGQGLARNLDDFGAQGAWPTHPQLLDWLAAEFVDSGWDVKHVYKLILMSATYRQSSLGTQPLLETDPTNELWARQNRFRLDAEFVRDSALTISGLLSPKIGGPSVKPYQPDGYWAYLNYPKREYVPDSNEDQYRRGLYVHWQRTLVHPSLLAFDAPDREVCTVARNRSNTPTQALVLLNDPTYLEAARALAERVLLESPEAQTDGRIDWMMQQVLCRGTRGEERSLLRGLLERQYAEYAADPAAAEKLLSIGLKPVSSGLDKPELAAWTSVARAVLNVHAAVTRN